MKIDLKILEKYYDDGLIYRQVHPTYDLSIWNYTPKVQFERLWDDITLRCRGLITDGEGNIVAHCLSKFFNWEELEHDQIPNESFTMTDKMDGSFGNIFHYDDKWLVSSRGSFTSDQAVKAAKILEGCNTKYGLIPGWNYITEIIYPENRIVVDYGRDEKLVVLTVFNVETGEEGSIENMTSEGWNIVKKYDGLNSFVDIKNMIDPKEEGYVIRFKSGFRMKIKGEEYCRLHKIVTNVSTRTVWGHLKDNKPIDELIDNVPDEFYKWVKEQINSYNEMFRTTKAICELIYIKDIKEDMTRKEVAEIVLSKDKRYHGILFGLYDNRNVDHMIWSLLYPEYSKPFFNQGNEG